MVNFLSYTIQQFTVGQYNLKEAVTFVKYYESILSPAIAIEAMVVDQDGILSGGRGGDGLRGGEPANIQINSPGGELQLSNIYLREISDASIRETSSVFLLTFTTSSALINETSRCVKRYDGKISDIVSTIGNDTFQSGGNSFYVEPTENEYTFIGNARKPFHTITWLSTKSIPNKGRGVSNTEGSAGYLFYEDKVGHNFVSVDSLTSGSIQNRIGGGDLTYTQSNYQDPMSNAGQFTILNYSYDTNYDLLENLRLGMFSNVNYFWDAYEQTTRCYQYNLNDNYGIQMKTMVEAASPYQVPLGLETSPSRILLSVLDRGSLERTGERENVEKFVQEQTKYQAQAIVRYNLLFSQTVSITIPSNVSLRVGNAINCNFLQPNGGRDEIRSGRYLISELSHQFTDNNGYSGVKLIRDSYGD